MKKTSKPQSSHPSLRERCKLIAHLENPTKIEIGYKLMVVLGGVGVTSEHINALLTSGQWRVLEKFGKELLSIESLDLPPIMKFRFWKKGINTIAQLSKLSDEEMRKVAKTDHRVRSIRSRIASRRPKEIV